MRVVFMGTPDFAVPALRTLIEAGHEIAAVYSQPPRPAGRGQREQRSPVQEYAESRGIAVHTPTRLKDAAAQAEFAALNAEIGVVVAYGLILPQVVLDAPQRGCLNIHASLLPRWRGAAPIQRALLAGDAETGVTIMRMDAGLDTGPMLLQQRLKIGDDDTAQTLHDRLALLGAGLIVEALRRLQAGDLLDQSQPAEGVTYAAKLTRDEGRLDWTRTASELVRQVRAFDPWPGAWFEHKGERIKVLEASVQPGNKASSPATVIDDQFAIACRADSLRPLRLQWAGKSPMKLADFLRGYPVPAGTVIGGS